MTDYKKVNPEGLFPKLQVALRGIRKNVTELKASLEQTKSEVERMKRDRLDDSKDVGDSPSVDT